MEPMRRTLYFQVDNILFTYFLIKYKDAKK